MRSILNFLLRAFKVVSYVAFAVVGTAVLAIAGLIFAIIDLVRWRRRRAGETPQQA
jgi:hypothetical protein